MLSRTPNSCGRELFVWFEMMRAEIARWLVVKMEPWWVVDLKAICHLWVRLVSMKV